MIFILTNQKRKVKLNSEIKKTTRSQGLVDQYIIREYKMYF